MIPLGYFVGQPAFAFAALFGASAAFRRMGFGIVVSGCLGLVSLGTVSFAALVASYAALPNVALQSAFVGATAVTVLLLLALAIRYGGWRDELAVPAGLALAATYASLAATYIGHVTDNPLFAVMTRWLPWLPPDNLIPYHFAEAFKTGAVPTGWAIPVMGSWQFSDRPPLQTALFMLTPGYLAPTVDMWAYEGASVAFQGFGVYAVWLFARALSDDRRVAALAAVAIMFTPLAIVHGSYVWPKLLAGAYTLAFAILTLTAAGRDIRASHKGIAMGATAALAMLSHGGSIFALLPIALLAVAFRGVTSLRQAGFAMASAIVLYGPWAFYQRVIDPPGDRLIKWHLAGIEERDPRSLGAAIADAYRATGVHGALAARWQNLHLLWHDYAATFHETGRIWHDVLTGSSGLHADVMALHSDQFFYVMPSISLCGVALFLVPLIAWLWADLRAVCIAIWATLFVWIALIFEPAGTVVHQGSFFPEMALVVIAIVAAARVRPAAAIALVVAQAVVVTFQYAM